MSSQRNGDGNAAPLYVQKEMRKPCWNCLMDCVK